MARLEEIGLDMRVLVFSAAVAALTGVCRQSSYEGEAAMRLEAAAEAGGAEEGPPEIRTRLHSCSKIPYAVIGDGCQVGKQAQVQESILFAGTKAANRQKVIGMVASRANRLRVSPLAGNTQILESQSDGPEDKK